MPDNPTTVVPLGVPTIAEPPGKAEMLDVLDRIRRDVVNNEVVGLEMTPIYMGGRARTIVRGVISRLEIIGALACSQHDLMNAMLMGSCDD